MKKFQNLAIALATVGILGFACEREEINPADPQPAARSFSVNMTDGPGDYAALDVQILKVEAFVEGEGWIMLSNQAHTYNVLSLTNGAQTEIAATGSGAATLGAYTKLRLTFGSENRLTLNAAAAAQLGSITGNGSGVVDLSFGGTRTVEIEIDEKVTRRAGAAVLLDFNVAESIHQNADQYVLTPAIHVIEDASTGVRGHVTGAASAAITLSGNAGEFSTYTNAQGDFLLRGIPEGTYQMVVTPAQEMGPLGQTEPKVVEGMVVLEGEISSAGTISF